MALDAVWTDPTEQTSIASSSTRQNEDVLQNILYLYSLLGTTTPFSSIVCEDDQVVCHENNVVYSV